MQHKNFCGYALTDLQLWNDIYESRNWHISLKINKLIMNLLTQSEKFVLPVNGQIIDVTHIKPAMAHLIKLPYDIVSTSLEVDCTKTLGDEKIPIVKTIALAARSCIWKQYIIENNIPSYYFPFIKQDEDGIVVWPICPIDDSPWTAGWSGVFIPDNIVIDKHGLQVQTCFHGEYGDAIGRIIANEGKDVVALGVSDVITELYSIVGLCCALNCSNIIVEPSKRAPLTFREKKPPKKHFEYKCLKIVLPHKEYKKVSSGHSGISPCEHLRRGHIRSFASGKWKWIQSTIVNPGHGVPIRKEYVIKTPIK
jgi:hypothetical protein